MILPPFRGFVRVFVLICSVVFLMEKFIEFGPLNDPQLLHSLIRFLGLEPNLFFRGLITQPITWVFLHGNLMHLLFNMFAFWMFGSLLEATFGTKRFIRFNFIAALITAGVILIYSLFDPLTFHTPTIGASGLVFAILIAVSILFPNQVVLLFFIFPIKMKYFAYLMIGIEFYALYTSNSHGISNIGHLGGALAGFLYTRWINRSFPQSTGSSWISRLRHEWEQKRRRKNIRIIYPEDRQKYN
jgi:membrane associated rhomboid family serine protease